MSALVKYDAACRALAEAASVDEVLLIRDQADMMRAAGRIAKNRDLEMQAIEIRMRGERRLGQIIAQQKETRGLAKGGRPSDKTRSSEEQVSAPITLEQAGIDRKLSSRAQKMAAVPEDRFEQLVDTWRAESKVADTRLTTNLLAVGAEEEQRRARRDLAQALSDTSFEMTGTRKYAALYIDPPWKRKQGITSRSYENHYVTMTWDEIIAWAEKFSAFLLDDSWVFMWIPRAHMFALHPVAYPVHFDGKTINATIKTPLGWAVARALGCDNYCTSYNWTKTDEDNPDDIGGGILVRDQDEVLLMFKRGRGLPKPATSEIVGSNHRERSKPLGHSRKPQHYREMIAKMTGGVPVLECFARHDAQFPLPANWDSWGNEAEDQSQAKATEGKAGMAVSDQGHVRQSTAGTGLRVGAASAVLPATSEIMDVTAGETALNSSVDANLDIPEFLRRSA